MQMIEKGEPRRAGQLMSSCPGKSSYDLYLAVLVLYMRPCVFIEITEAWKSAMNGTCRVEA